MRTRVLATGLAADAHAHSRQPAGSQELGSLRLLLLLLALRARTRKQIHCRFCCDCDCDCELTCAACARPNRQRFERAEISCRRTVECIALLATAAPTRPPPLDWRSAMKFNWLQLGA